jgi:hypothetical protein
VIFADRIRSIGKQARGESGKYPVNEEDEEIATPCEYANLSFRPLERGWELPMCFPRHCERSEAIHRTA